MKPCGLALTALLLAGCSGTPLTPPLDMTDAQKQQVRLVQDRYARCAAQYPPAIGHYAQLAGCENKADTAFGTATGLDPAAVAYLTSARQKAGLLRDAGRISDGDASAMLLAATSQARSRLIEDHQDDVARRLANCVTGLSGPYLGSPGPFLWGWRYCPGN